MAIQSITLGSAAADSTAYTQLTLSPGRDVPNGGHDLGSQVAVLGGMLNGNSGNATVQFILRSTVAGTVIRRHVTVTLTAVAAPEDHPDGTTGSNYRATASPATVDLAGHGELDPTNNAPLAWYVGVTAYTTVSAGRLDVVTTRAI